jgi:carbamate kinase
VRIVIALGGNALLKRGEALTAENQRNNMRAAAAGLAAICAGNEVAIVHGNGPQVGLLALEAEAYKAVPPYPLDVLGAESQGMIGYVIAQELSNALPERAVTAMLTQVVVIPGDPAFKKPEKPIGPVYASDAVLDMERDQGWTFAPDGNGVRRVVASPEPQDIVECAAIEALMARGVIVICAGGGGIPVMLDQTGRLQGLEAVVDKDLTAALLAERVGADRLIILTDVEAVFENWGSPGQKPILALSATDLMQRSFAKGSMAPKIKAACTFVTRTGHSASIGALPDAEAVMAGRAGTRIMRSVKMNRTRAREPGLG